MALRIFPQPVRVMLASKSMRLRHEMWHFVREVWNHPQFPEEGRQILRDLQWDLPDDRAPFSADDKPLLDNFSGEDFLYMHRQMIAMVDNLLAQHGEPPITRWTNLPPPNDNDFPVPPHWEYRDPEWSDQSNTGMSQFLIQVKSNEYFERTMRVRAEFFTDPENLRHLSLGALGNLLEMTIHNMMHMRWSVDPGAYRPRLDIANPISGDLRWDDLSYDYLGDTYSSHVNPHFWHLHGWIDTLVDSWAQANRVNEIDWTGTWVGGPSLTGDKAPIEEAEDSNEMVSELPDGNTSAIAKLARMAEDFDAPRALS